MSLSQRFTKNKTETSNHRKESISPSRSQVIKRLRKETLQLKLHHKEKLQQELADNKSILELLNQQIATKKKQSQEQIRKKIEERITKIKQYQILRQKAIEESNRQISRLKLSRIHKQTQREQKIKSWSHGKVQEKKNLQKRKLILKAIDFYDLTNQKVKNVLTKRTTKALESAKMEYLTSKNQNKTRMNIAKEMALKRIEYGQTALKKYKNNTVKLSKLKEQEAIQRIHNENERYRDQILKYKKQRHGTMLRTEDLIQSYESEIKKIKKSNNLNYFEKFEILNNLSKGYVQKFECGKQYAIDMATQANLAMAQLYLNQSKLSH